MCCRRVATILVIAIALAFACEPAEICRNDFTENDDIYRFSVLQIRSDAAKTDASKQVEEKVHLEIGKLAWLHVPKTGTSFANVLLSYACPDMPETVWVNESYAPKPHYNFASNFMSTQGKKHCPSTFTLCGAPHVPIGKTCMDWKLKSANFVTMLRQPEQRIISAFKANQRNFTFKNCRNCSLPEYAEIASGMAVRMLNGHPWKDTQIQITPEMVDNAIHRLETGFAFVGLTEEWPLSVCLFHKMFGGRPQKRDFLDVRPGKAHSNLYDVSALENFTDPYDGPVYARATELFWANVEKFNATRAACRESCSESTTYFNE